MRYNAKRKEKRKLKKLKENQFEFMPVAIESKNKNFLKRHYWNKKLFRKNHIKSIRQLKNDEIPIKKRSFFKRKYEITWEII